MHATPAIKERKRRHPCQVIECGFKQVEGNTQSTSERPIITKAHLLAAQYQWSFFYFVPFVSVFCLLYLLRLFFQFYKRL